ncbi:hypothetical protein I3271_05710 [Photobacterium leiognathi]|uniref:defense against restriction DarA-related protein n=1 Tax=Photobacterium leiognathi TaxID=553611 RepID=UPI001EDDDDE5|nr:hypothetical protein [Photobacterium leiognathi]MCG3884178.1 hypothetical protein [Photobacterium leiognathi]
MKREFKYTVVDFDNVTEKGLKELLTAIKRGGLEVESVEANNRKSKRDGFSVKKAKLNFDGGQSATLFVGEYGDMFQLVINGKKTPLPNANTLKAFAKGLVDLINRGQEAFDKSAAKKAARIPNTSNDKPISRSLKKRADEAAKYISTLNANKQNASDALTAIQSQKANVDSLEQQKMAELEREKAETAELKEQLSELKGQQ